MKSNSFILNKIQAALISVLLVLVMLAGASSSVFAYDSIRTKDVTPEVAAKSAIVYSEDLNKIIYSKNPDLRVNPYSTTKLMTAYIVVKNLPLDQKVTVKGVKADLEESKMDLEEGEVLTVKQLLQGLLVESGNDAARMLAITVAGSESAFAELMNEQAKEWGCKGTHFVNASGMQASGHYTTAADYIVIGRKVLADETIHRICASKKVKIPATNKSKERVYTNHTTLIEVPDSGVVGGKTGYWNEEDCSVVLQYYKKDMSLTMVLFADTKEDRPKDVARVTTLAHDMVPGYIVAKPKTEVDRLWIKGGVTTHIPVYVKERAYAYPKDGSESSVKVKTTLKDGVKAPLKKGQCVGKADVYVDGKLTATHKVYVKKAVKKGWFTSNLYISNTGAIAILITAVLVAILVYVLRLKFKQRKRKRTKGSVAPNDDNIIRTGESTDLESE
ncbi:MAG: D-alanyl-D-alanine carboxypeptidase [Clostridiales bacterium]|nr:D-alanyl-D-alanine carboxypeptidase [Candidatus Crickella merdequi]